MLFLASDTHLITTGSRDFCILQWSVEGNLPAFNEEEEYEMETDMQRAGRHQNQNRQRGSDNESYHSDYSVDDHDEDNYNDFPANPTRGKQAGARQRPSENRYSDAASSLTLEVPPGHGRPSRKTYQQHSSGDDRRVTDRSPQRNALPQNSSRSQQGSYTERFNKQKPVNSNAKWNSQSNYPHSDPADMDQYSDDDDDDSPRQPPGHEGRGRGRGAERSRFPARGQGRQWDRRPMK